MKKFLQITPILLVVLPSFAHAQQYTSFEIIQYIGRLVNLAIPIVGAIALLIFFWGLAKFILKSGGEKGVEEGKNIMKWGLIALFVMMSVWGLIRFFQNEFGIQGANGNITLPTLNAPGV